jgi:hypothetical protein
MLLTPKELAARLKIHTNTLAKWRMINVGPKYLRMGEGPKSRVRYRLTDVEEFERTNQHMGKS